MLINLVLLAGLFAGKKWKWPYLGAILFGVIKGIFYFVAPLKTESIGLCLLNGLIGAFLFGGLAAALVFFLRRLDRDAPVEANYATPGTEKMKFRWEYIPLAIAVIFLVFGEMILAMI